MRGRISTPATQPWPGRRSGSSREKEMCTTGLDGLTGILLKSTIFFGMGVCIRYYTFPMETSGIKAGGLTGYGLETANGKMSISVMEATQALSGTAIRVRRKVMANASSL